MFTRACLPWWALNSNFNSPAMWDCQKLHFGFCLLSSFFCLFSQLLTSCIPSLIFGEYLKWKYWSSRQPRLWEPRSYRKWTHTSMRSLLWAHFYAAPFLWDLSPLIPSCLKLQSSPASDTAPGSRLLLLSVWHLSLMPGVDKCPQMKRQQQIQGSPQRLFLPSEILTHQVLSVLVALRWLQIVLFFNLFLVEVLLWYIRARNIHLWRMVFLLFLFRNLYSKSPQMLMFDSLTKWCSSGNMTLTQWLIQFQDLRGQFP